jgi:hypothetical protein
MSQSMVGFNAIAYGRANCAVAEYPNLRVPGSVGRNAEGNGGRRRGHDGTRNAAHTTAAVGAMTDGHPSCS